MRSFGPLQAAPSAAGRKSDGGSALATAGSMLGSGLGVAGRVAGEGLGLVGDAAKSLGRSIGGRDGIGFAAEGTEKYQQPRVDEYDRRTNSPEHQQAIQAQNTPGTPEHSAYQKKLQNHRSQQQPQPIVPPQGFMKKFMSPLMAGPR